MEVVIIETEFIKLDQLLKLTGVAETGGHAKIIIQENLVKLNGEVCNQRGKKIYPDDIINIAGEYEFIVKI